MKGAFIGSQLYLLDLSGGLRVSKHVGQSPWVRKVENQKGI
jgi:hypothetical protein